MGAKLITIKRKRVGGQAGARQEQTQITSPLLNQTGRVADGKLHWGDWEKKEAQRMSLTNAEEQALKRMYGTPKINLRRAEMVKAGMAQGLTIDQMEAQFRPHGLGFGRRMIAYDHATLSKFTNLHKMSVQ